MTMIVDQNRLNSLIKDPHHPEAANELRRSGNIFFVGGELPVNETLETMFESFCTESTELFYLTFGSINSFLIAEEMARQIKKNFHSRLMGRLTNSLPPQYLERIYAAGVDLIDIPPAIFSEATPGNKTCDKDAWLDSLLAARSVFPRWSVAATLLAGMESPDATLNEIDALLKEGIVPLMVLEGSSINQAPDVIAAIFNHVASGWKRYDVPIKPYMPVINYMTPLSPVNPPGLFRGLIDRIHDRKHLVASDLRRHLRLKHAEDSLDSAAL